MLQEQPGAYRADCTRCFLNLGKWNISTDSEHYQALKNGIDQEMPLIYATTTTDGRFVDFPEPTCLGQNSTRLFKPKSSPSAYSAQTCQQYGATDTAPTVKPARQAWQRQPVDIEYSLKDTTEFTALSSTKIDDTKSTASSTRCIVL
jgi:hypothetical protein